ncbi:MAG: hypothetical protein IPJ77_05340 [Planctomycetes bacterium]|nr:hypothetical protein [Planctomycetota bacterium]
MLLFPQLDNRPGERTLFTISDGCCNGVGGNVSIEVFYINKNTCLERNAVLTLTPCDSVTWLSRFVIPDDMEGYAYAYARTTGGPLGTPIVYNHFVGIETILNGIENFDYSINAVSFKGIGNELALNDDDNDGIRDLNGPGATLPEYEEAPAQIVIPRFFGQDPPGTTAPPYDSELILIALSGGASFTTIARLSAFNDKGTLTGRFTQSFFCWDKRPLRDWNPGTLNTALNDVDDPNDDDPNEPLGLGARQAGWLLIDGVTSSSTGPETIQDPALYAVLIDRANGGTAATLPFELCSQTNGDLLPVSIFGDGPNPSNGDNQ